MLQASSHISTLLTTIRTTKTTFQTEAIVKATVIGSVTQPIAIVTSYLTDVPIEKIADEAQTVVTVVPPKSPDSICITSPVPDFSGGNAMQ